MNPERYFVFDTNALVSALLFPHSVPGRAFFAGSGCGKMLLSKETVAELSEVLEWISRQITDGE